MSSIGLYDIDFFHSSRKIPNLELMKIFSYFYNKGDIVVMVNPKESLLRFSMVYFFKETNVPIPKHLDLSGERRQVIGHGFYRKAPVLNDDIKKEKPNYLPYDLNIDKFPNEKSYEKIKKGSLIRLETNDFSDFDKSKKNIYLVDNNIASISSFEDFYKEYGRDYNINFLRSIIVDNEKDFLRFFPYKSNIVLNYQFSKELFLKYMNEPVIFAPAPINETNEEYIVRLLKMVLIAKRNGNKLKLQKRNFNSLILSKYPFLELQNLICDWNDTEEQISLYEFLNGNDDLINLIQDKIEIRLLSKINPLKYDTTNVDFWNRI